MAVHRQDHPERKVLLVPLVLREHLAKLALLVEMVSKAPLVEMVLMARLALEGLVILDTMDNQDPPVQRVQLVLPAPRVSGVLPVPRA